MAVVTRYFATSGAGAADGTSWADRAPFLSAGVMSTIVTAFNFTSDSLIAVIDPGTYVPTTAPTFTGASVPSRSFPCGLVAGDGAGGIWEPPNPDWTSAQPVWDDTNMPHFDSATVNLIFFGAVGLYLYGIKHTTVNTSVRVISNIFLMDWCYFIHNGSNSSAIIADGNSASYNNCVFRMTGSSYNAVFSSFVSDRPLVNTRLEGNTSASSGTRAGIITSANTIVRTIGSTVIGHPGAGVNQSGTGTNAFLDVVKSVFYENGSSGVLTAGTSTGGGRVTKSVFVGNGAYGIDVSTTIPLYISECRLRDNTSGNINGANVQNQNETASGTDSDEFVNVSGAVSTWDLRIKNTSSLWGFGYGPEDEPASGGGGGSGGSFTFS